MNHCGTVSLRAPHPRQENVNHLAFALFIEMSCKMCKFSGFFFSLRRDFMFVLVLKCPLEGITVWLF